MTSSHTESRYWTRTSEKQPPEGVVVDTMISDIGGERNKQQLKRRGRLWYHPDGSMYVYYVPTHWSELLSDEKYCGSAAAVGEEPGSNPECVTARRQQEDAPAPTSPDEHRSVES